MHVAPQKKLGESSEQEAFCAAFNNSQTLKEATIQAKATAQDLDARRTRNFFGNPTAGLPF
jgi:hypothetical protein